MSDAEDAPVAQVEEQTPAEESPGQEDAPVLTLPKERVKKPVRPDDTEMKTQIDLLQKQINKNKQRMQQIGQHIDDRKAGRTEGSKEQQGVKSKLVDLKGQFQQRLGQKQALRSELDSVKKSRETARNTARELKSSLKFTTVEQIDAQIANLEERVNHSSLTLNEEKRCLEDIKKLKQSRATVGQYSEKLKQLEVDDGALDGIMSKIKGLDEELNKIKAQEEELRQQLADIRAREEEKFSDFPSLYREKDECREICKQAYEKIKELRADHNAKWDHYKEQQQLWNLQWQEDKKRKQEQYLAERARRDSERAARMAELAGEPFDKEITMCEQVLNYLAKFVTAGATAAQEKKVEVAPPAGFAPLQKKAEDEKDAWIMGGVGKKGPKGGKGKGKKGSGEEVKGKAAERGDEKLSHSLDILEAFTTLKLEVPLTKSKVAPLLGEVKAKKEYFLQKREDVKANGVPAMQPEEEGGAEGEEAGKAAAAKPQPKGGKGAKKNGKVEDLKLDDESWPSISGAPLAPAAAKGGSTKAEDDEGEAEVEGVEEAGAEAETEADAKEGVLVGEPVAKTAAASPGADVSVSLTVTDEGDQPSVSVAITAH